MSERSTGSTQHVCKNADANPGVIRLSVAPRINHRIRFAPLQAKAPAAILPQTALRAVEDLHSAGSTVSAVLISGPGDPLADVDMPLQTIALLRTAFPALKIVIQTLGINGLQHADKYQKAGISEVELLIDGVQPQVLEQIYAWIRPGFKTLKLSEAAAILCTEQAKSIQAFKDAGVKVRIVSTYYPTINNDHLDVLARKVADLGADEMVLIPYSPSPEADILLPAPEPAEITACIKRLTAYLPVTEGRSDTHSPDNSDQLLGQMPRPRKERPNVAVVSSNGMDVDLHLGQAPQLLVYGPREDGLNCLLECRPAPEPGIGEKRWDLLASTISDCFALLTASAGERPRRILDKHGIQVIVTKDDIEATVDTLYGGGKKGRGKRPVTT